LTTVIAVQRRVRRLPEMADAVEKGGRIVSLLFSGHVVGKLGRLASWCGSGFGVDADATVTDATHATA
jgi:hypothetical protein